MELHRFDIRQLPLSFSRQTRRKRSIQSWISSLHILVRVLKITDIVVVIIGITHSISSYHRKSMERSSSKRSGSSEGCRNTSGLAGRKTS